MNKKFMTRKKLDKLLMFREETKYLVTSDEVRMIKKKTRKESWVWFSVFSDGKLIRKARMHMKKLAHAGCDIDFSVDSKKINDKYKAYETRFEKAKKVIQPSLPKVKIYKLQHPRHFIDDLCLSANNPKAILKAVGRSKPSGWVKDAKETRNTFVDLDAIE